jgi:hypothetical protein
MRKLSKGADVIVTIICDFHQFSAEKMRFSQKPMSWSYFFAKTSIILDKKLQIFRRNYFIKHNIGPWKLNIIFSPQNTDRRSRFLKKNWPWKTVGGSPGFWDGGKVRRKVFGKSLQRRQQQLSFSFKFHRKSGLLPQSRNFVWLNRSTDMPCKSFTSR